MSQRKITQLRRKQAEFTQRGELGKAETAGLLANLLEEMRHY